MDLGAWRSWNVPFQVIKWELCLYVKCEKGRAEIPLWKSILLKTQVNGIKQGWLPTTVSPFYTWQFQGLTIHLLVPISSESLEILHLTGHLLALPGVPDFPWAHMKIRSSPPSFLYRETISFLLSFGSHQTLSAKDPHHSNWPDDR